MIGLLAPLAGSLLGGWKKWLAVGLALLALGAVIGVQRIQLAHRAAAIAALEAAVATRDAWLDRARADIAEAKRINDGNLFELETLRQAAEAAIAAVTADRDRLVAEGAKVRIIRERIHAEAPACVGVPAAVRSVAEWLRANPDPAAGGD